MTNLDQKTAERPHVLRRDAVAAATRPKVSVMLITYNHGAYIAQAIESVLMQETDFHFTINVIEDCSTDNTADIVRDYAARFPGRVIPFLNQKNIGFKRTQRNFVRGFRTLEGEYFAILEGDDYWTSSQKLQKQVDFLDQNPDYAVCAHNTIKIYDDGSMDPHRFLYHGKQPDGTIDDAISLRLFFHTAGVLYRNVYNGVPPRQYVSKWSCDIFVLISHAAYGKIHHLDEDLAVYRAHAGGRFSTMSKLAGWKFNISGLQRYNAWLGFRFMKPFAKSIAKYCDVILTDSGTDGIDPLSPSARLKYTGTKYVYLTIYAFLDLPVRLKRALMGVSIRLRDRLESSRLTAVHEQYRREGRDRTSDSREQSTAAVMQARHPITNRIRAGLLGIVNRILKHELSEVRLPSVEQFGPQPVRAGEPFNVQDGGRSALWIRLSSPAPVHTKMVFNGRGLETVVVDEIVTASVPAGLTAKPGWVPVWLEADDVDGTRISDPVYFEVAAPTAEQHRRCPAIVGFGPQKVEHGQPFNVQDNGQSAMWLQLDEPPPLGARLMFGQTALPIVIHGQVITAFVPADLTIEPGTVSIRLETTQDGTVSQSVSVQFEVT